MAGFASGLMKDGVRQRALRPSLQWQMACFGAKTRHQRSLAAGSGLKKINFQQLMQNAFLRLQ
jgi:hypothetical protein